MDVKDLASKFGSFLDKHSGELSVVAGVLEAAIRALPISPAERALIDEAISSLHTSAASIKESATKIVAVTEAKDAE